MGNRIQPQRLFQKPRTLQNQLLVLVSVVVLVQIFVSGAIFTSLIGDVLIQQIGKRALDTATTLALDPVVRRALVEGDSSGEVQRLAESVRRGVGAEYVVVGDRFGMRLSHPDPSKIGQEFVGGDIGPALEEGKSYVSHAVGTLGPSLRGIVPVRDDAGAIIGFIAVGYLTHNVEKVIHVHQQKPLVFVLAMIVIGLLSAVFIARFVKRAILGLEPAEITSLYRERSAILEAIREGVVATNEKGVIRLVNKAAYRYTGLEPGSPIIGRQIQEVLPEVGIDDVIATGREEYDRDYRIDNKEIIFNMVPISHQGEMRGIVASFRLKDELDCLARELAQTRDYTEMLRVQAHEYSNKLHTLAGLIQIEAYQEALDLILKESTGYQDLIQFLAEAVPHPVISGVIIGKYNRARELKIEFILEPDSQLKDIPDWVSQEKIVSILGNLLDNALEAIRDSEHPTGPVRLWMTDVGRELILEVEDAGPGVDADKVGLIFEKGVSTKGEGKRGVGLFLVKRYLEDLGGQITVSRSELGGAFFTVIIPKTKAG